MLLQRFSEIDPTDPRTLVAYYEQNAHQIAGLPDRDQRKIHRSYLMALYELEDFQGYIQQCPGYLARLFESNEHDPTWRDDLHKCLYRQARAAYETGDLGQSRRTFEELMRLDPDHPGLIRMYTKVLIHQKMDLLQGISAITILSALMAALVIAVELFYIRPFAAEWIASAEILRIGLFGFSIVHFFTAHALLYGWMYRKAQGQLLQSRHDLHMKRMDLPN